MKYYIFDQINKAYIGIYNAQIDPIESKKQDRKIYLKPANSTHVKPDKFEQGYAQVFSNDSWQQVEDNIGKTVYDASGEPLKIKTLGTLPKGYTTTAPKKNMLKTPSNNELLERIKILESQLLTNQN